MSDLAHLLNDLTRQALTAKDAVVVAADLSGSVADEDAHAFAQEVAALAKNTSAKVMLAVMDTHMRGPLTEVTPAVREALQQNQWPAMARGGSDLEGAMVKALPAIMAEHPNVKALVFLSDLWDAVPRHEALIQAGLPQQAAVVFGVAPSTESEPAQVKAFQDGTQAYATMFSLAHGQVWSAPAVVLEEDNIQAPRRKLKL